MTTTDNWPPTGGPPNGSRAADKAAAEAVRIQARTAARARAADADLDREIRAQQARDERARRIAIDKDMRRRSRAEIWSRRRAAARHATVNLFTSDVPLELAFYAGVAVVALIGQTQAATRWLGWPTGFAAVAVALIEFGGVVLLGYADKRRRLGETALAAMLLSGLVAVGAIALNWFGHLSPTGEATVAGGFFAGLSALGYLVWLIRSAARRRDARRAAGDMAAPPPDYGLWQWINCPRITWLARQLHARDPQLGLHGSLDTAQAELDARVRRSRLAKLIYAEFRDKLPTKRAAQAAAEMYDLDVVAGLLREQADYPNLVDVLAYRLAPDRLGGVLDDDVDAGEPELSTPEVGAALSTVDTEPAPPTELSTPGAHQVDTEPAAEVHTRPDVSTPTDRPVNTEVDTEAAAKQAAEAAARKVLADTNNNQSKAARAYMLAMEERGFEWKPADIYNLLGCSRSLVHKVRDRLHDDPETDLSATETA